MLVAIAFDGFKLHMYVGGDGVGEPDGSGIARLVHDSL